MTTLLQSKFTEITLRHGCSPVNLLHVFRTHFLRTPLGGCFRAVKEQDDNINVQFTPELLNFFTGVRLQRYQNIRKVERPKISSTTNTLGHESNKNLEKEIRNSTDEKTFGKEPVRVKSQRMCKSTDEKRLGIKRQGIGIPQGRSHLGKNQLKLRDKG